MKLVFRIMLAATTLFVFSTTAALAQDQTPTVTPAAVVTASGILWQTPGAYQVDITISTPSGEVLHRQFAPGAQVQFDLLGSDGQPLPDGSYAYEIRASAIGRAPVVSGSDDGRTGATGAVSDATVSPLPFAQTGAFAVQGGAILLPGMSTESDGDDNGEIRPYDQVVADDMIVQSSLCVGFDCINGESFGFDTIRLKENNLRIAFDDTSATAGFAANDWALEANDSASGGANRFSLVDVTGSKTPVTVEAGAPTASLYVDDGGRVGFGTSIPVLDLHVVSNNTPAMRLEQDASAGWTPQTWDVAGNEANFFVRDLTNGSRLPFRIRPGAPTSSIDIAASGKVGIGNAAPSAALHVQRSDGSAQTLIEETSAITQARTLLNLKNNGAPREQFTNSSTGRSWEVGPASDDAFVISLMGTGGYEFVVFRDGRVRAGPGGIANMLLDAVGNLKIKGTLTQNTLAYATQQLQAGDSQALLHPVLSVTVLRYGNMYDVASVEGEGAEAKNVAVQRMIPQPAAFYTAFGLGADDGSLAPMDVATVALAGVQAEAQANAVLRAENEQLRAELVKLKARLAAIETALGIATPETPDTAASVYMPNMIR
ncbi:MAG: hypothetical protein IPK16_04270 [Anaerolineales bacterium]|nr:hypothetical protein [Anaerolineales bacterium]